MGLNPAKLSELIRRLPGTVESAHHGHPDFRVKGKIFATLSENQEHAAVRLSHLEARELALGRPDVFRPVSDREPIGWVSVRLVAIDEEELDDVLEAAWQLRMG